MRQLLELADAAFSAEERCVLCSVVRLQGSGYGRIGAKLLITESGQRVGYISGGCLERDLSRRVWSEAVQSPRLMAFDTRGETAASSRYNTGCRGIVTVLCQPLFSPEAIFYRIASSVIQRRQSARMLTVYHSTSSTIRIGDALVRYEDGTWVGTSDCVSNCDWARRLLESHEVGCTATIANLPDRSQLEVTVETLEPTRRLVIFGSGHDVRPVVDIALGMGWEVCVAGSQPLAGLSQSAGLQQYVSDVTTLSKSCLIDAHTDVLLMTHDLNRDVELLSWLLATPVKSIGSLGSKSRLARIITELYNRGYKHAPSQVDRIRCPIGLDIGAIGPEEIAVSVVAELIAMERGRAGATLSQRSGTVHHVAPHLNINAVAGCPVSECVEHFVPRREKREAFRPSI